MNDAVFAGMELMSNKFQVIITVMRKKPYDYLDQRKMDFDSDFEDFKRQIQELHVSGPSDDVLGAIVFIELRH